MPKNVLWFDQIDKNDIALAGGKGANLGEMTQAGFPVPPGFVVTSHAFYEFLAQNKLEIKIKHLLNTLNLNSPHSLKQVSDLIQKEIMNGRISDELVKEIYTAYKKLGSSTSDALVAVRSSATAEDLPGASFAGQQETFLNVKGESNLILKIKECWASLYEERAIFYRHENHFDNRKIGIAVPIQKMVESDKSGVMFTINPVNNDKTRLVIEAVYGLGEMIVQGKVKPDHYEISKADGKILTKEISSQDKLMKKSGSENKIVKVSLFAKKKQKITDSEIIELYKLGMKLEKHYFFPQDSEWAISGGRVYLVQTRPITTIATTAKKKEEPTKVGELILKGNGASFGIATNHVRILESAKDIDKLKQGEILVTHETNPDFVPAMKKASAIVTASGGRTSHAAIVSREIGIPAVVGATEATHILKDGMAITVNGSTGEIYKAGSTSTIQANSEASAKISSKKTATKVYVNLAEPELAEKESLIGADGVGLLRAEFMMAGIGTHPKKMIKDRRQKEYINHLAENISKFCSSFYPRPVVYRASDFKSNEYKNLVGGREFEPTESNPMLGYRGAFRYITDPEVFNLELEAIKQVRNEMGLKNLWLMLPFVRTPRELSEVKKLINQAGLTRSDTFKLWMMVEIPSNVILLEEFISVGIDGISIGTNDLTMLILGTDRDNSMLTSEFDERNPAVLWALEKIIKTAGKNKITSSICGQAASYTTILDVAIKSGVTSVSVAPDLVGPTRDLISIKEKEIFSR